MTTFTTLDEPREPHEIGDVVPVGTLVIDLDEQRDAPVRHRYVHGSFTGSDLRFSLHVPLPDAYRGRFFQYITPVPDSEHFSEGAVGEEDKVSFAITHGAAFLETNGGGRTARETGPDGDASFGAYRANATAAAGVRDLLQTIHGPHRVHGYAFGGSGGAFRTIAGAEHTEGVWDGFVPYVVGSPVSIPSCFTPRMLAMRVLGDRLDDVTDAYDVGGDRGLRALDDEQRAVLQEVTRMGFPPRSWFGHRTMGMHALALLYPAVRALDPTYFDDFWTVPGYEGADPNASVHDVRVRHRTTISGFLSASELAVAGIRAGDRPGESSGAADDAWLGSGGAEPRAAVRLASRPPRDPGAAELLVSSGASAGARIVVLSVVGDVAVLGPADSATVAALAVGDELVVDNSGFLAVQTYHRHQVPSRDFPVWDQFRDARGEPQPPQRDLLLGPVMAAGASGSVQTGRFSGRMILVESLLDREAWPWQADWYRRRVEEHSGPAGTNDRFRLWMTDNALHGDFSAQEFPDRTVSYLGILQQALLDLVEWVEHDVAPPRSTEYEVTDGQVQVPAAALERGGVQPVVELTANGAVSSTVRVGEDVVLHVDASTPGVGAIVAVEWWDARTAEYGAEGAVEPAPTVRRERHVSFPEPGTYFPTVRVTAERSGETTTDFCRVQNLARTRVVVV